MQIGKKKLAGRNEHSQIEVKGFIANFYATGIGALAVILCLICLCSTVNAADYYAGQNYTFSIHNYPGYIYLWTAVDELGKPVGTYTDNTHYNFVWTAPLLAQKVNISVIVSANLLESCKEYGELVIDVLPLSSITVVKDAAPDDLQAFDFNLTGQGNFSLIDNGDPTNAHKSFSGLISGTYIIKESCLVDWDLTDISVTGIASTPTIDRSAGTISFYLAEGEAVTVTFTNTKRGSIVVVKDAIPNDLQDFALTATGPESFSSSFTLDDDSNVNGEDSINSNQTALNNLKPGTYVITESDLANWDLTDISVTGTASTPTIDKSAGTISFYLAEGEAVTVTFTNTKRGSITVIKDAIPIDVAEEYDNQTFSFSSNTLGTFTLVDDGPEGQPNRTTFNNLMPGDYQIIEQYQSGWILHYINCIGADSNDLTDANGTVIHLKEGESATVTFVNSQSSTPLPGVGSITVIKNAIPNDGTDYSTQEFTFLSSLAPQGSFTLVDDGSEGQPNSTTFYNLPLPGDYQIIEQSQNGWHLNLINCTGASSDEDGTGTTIHLVEGSQNATVTFVNSQDSPLPGGKLTINKTTLNTSVHRGEDIIYNIEVCNVGDVPLTNVTVWDILPAGVELVSVYPASSSSSSSNLSWFVGTLEPHECFLAQIVVRVPIVDINYDMSQDVQGEGFVNVHNDYDTHQGPESVTNCAYARADLTETVSSCATTGIIDPGTVLQRREFGSGTYESEELTRIRTENKSIKTVTSLSAVHKPTTFSLPQGRSIGYATKWTEKSKGKNTITGANMNEEYTSATRIDKDRSIELDENGSTMKTEVEFVGQGHIGILKKESPDAHPRIKPIFESAEDYVGSFRVFEMVDEYGSNVQSNKSVTGYGYVAVDQRVRDSQRTYESGTGSYESEELIDTPTSYIAKDVNLVHGPTNYSYSPSFGANQDMLWSEGMWSKNGVLRGGDVFKDSSNCGIPAIKTDNSSPPASYISERYSSIDYLKKESFALGLNEMNTNVSFSGMADYRVKSVGTNYTNKIDNEELYAGRYNVTRKVLITGVAKYDRPHITVTKEGNVTTEWFNKTNANVAEYVITITNDGTSSLAPIKVRDVFPPGTEYIGSSIRPSSLSRSDANWTLLNLGIGNSVTIQLTLNITDYAPGNIVNRVMVCGMKGDSCISSAAYSSLESDPMTCCPPEVFVDKTAKLDALDPTLVHYTIAVKNNANNTMAATVTDRLPAGLSLLQASPEPNVDGGLLMQWVIADLVPGEVETIEYDVRAAMDGSYVNAVHVDATAVDGTGYATKDASARIDIGSTGVAPKTTRYGGWQAPNWNMTSPDEGITIELSPEEDLVE